MKIRNVLFVGIFSTIKDCIHRKKILKHHKEMVIDTEKIAKLYRERLKSGSLHKNTLNH